MRHFFSTPSCFILFVRASSNEGERRSAHRALPRERPPATRSYMGRRNRLLPQQPRRRPEGARLLALLQRRPGAHRKSARRPPRWHKTLIIRRSAATATQGSVAPEASERGALQRDALRPGADWRSIHGLQPDDVVLPPTGKLPRLDELWQSDDAQGKLLREFPRKFNSALALAYEEVLEPDVGAGSGWQPSVVIQRRRRRVGERRRR